MGGPQPTRASPMVDVCGEIGTERLAIPPRPVHRWPNVNSVNGQGRGQGRAYGRCEFLRSTTAARRVRLKPLADNAGVTEANGYLSPQLVAREMGIEGEFDVHNTITSKPISLATSFGLKYPLASVTPALSARGLSLTRRAAVVDRRNSHRPYARPCPRPCPLTELTLGHR